MFFLTNENFNEQKFLEMDILVEGLSLEIPIYVVTEGHEPPFFTRYFSWDHSKAKVLLFSLQSIKTWSPFFDA